MSWKDLDIKLKAELIKLGVLSGIRDIKLIRLLYDDNNTPTLVVDLSYNETNVKPLLGIERIKLEYGTPEDEVNKANEIIKQIENEISLEEINNQLPVLFRLFKNGGYKDNPPFILRILNNDRRSVKDWQNNDYQSTHKLSYALTPEGYIVYPEVQEVNGLLHDFTDPKYKHGKWDALDNAIRNNDTLRFPTELDALRYTQEYKLKYPEYFKLFNKGGYIYNPTLTYSGGGPIRRKRENSLSWRMAAYNAIDPRTTVKNIENAFRLYNAAVAKEKSGETSKDYTLDNTIGDLTADAAWRKRLLLPYDETLLPVWNGDTVSLSKPLELEIPVDTNLVKDRIDYAQNEFWNDVKSLNLKQLKEDLAYKKSQEELLEALRYTYKTGKPIGVSEYHANSIDPEKVLKDFKYGNSPLNVLGRYNIRYDKDENKMYYSDEWDFNQYEWAVPGKTFRIRGAIPLNNKNEGKVKKYSKGGYKDEDKNGSFKTSKEIKSEPKVSKNYYENFPNLIYAMINRRYTKELQLSKDYEWAKRVDKKDMENYLLRILNNFTENDSIFYTPILQRLENIVPKTYNLNTDVSRELKINEDAFRNKILLYGLYKHAYPYNEDYEFIHNMLNNTTDEELIKVLETDFQKATIGDLIKLKPEKTGLLDLIKAYNIMENKNGGFIFPNLVFSHKFEK